MEKVEKGTRTRNRRGEGGRLRDEIVLAAIELLDESGDERTLTLRSIARQAGIAAPSIYKHFPDQPAIMLAVVRSALAELNVVLREAGERPGAGPRQRLEGVCHAYLDFARTHPQRYRTMFGGLWVPNLSEETSVRREDMQTLGDESFAILGTALAACVEAGESTADPSVDVVALWLGLHGLAHQRASTAAFPWPEGIEERLISSLAQLRP
ncbi:TetR/AcrR family transcriptional regulator [Kineosporia succinea]|uniref:AcrR family transcriptional regulator n=1 Tax=Kineosporia succinea TaxID=84632 RepID=A0ABT9PD91_9ACTN|nr:TetR/AcrR family transcriptional regulator [Kineosporia succinea]MDP9830665.1 AcrR family transcriptional regulator [Kineosporia succinea]